jgi:Tol biopolymer transport system component
MKRWPVFVRRATTLAGLAGNARSRRRLRPFFVAVITAAVGLSTVSLSKAPAHATFHGKNGRIAFRRALGPHRGAIFTIAADGTHERQLTHPGPHRWTTEPNWSPSGRWIVYDVFRQANPDDARIFKMRANGTNRTRLDACADPCLTDSWPAWSPHGKRIVFGRGLGPRIGSNNVRAIFTMRADGSHARQLTQVGADPQAAQPYADDDPVWSPNGGRVAFQRTRNSDSQHAIFTVRLDGSHVRRLTPWRLDCASPDWSPNGRWIAFRTNENSDTRGAIGLVRPTGRHLHLITSRRPSWGLLSISPNGRQIVASLNEDLYRMSIRGTHRRLVVATDKSDAIPAWGPMPR